MPSLGYTIKAAEGSGQKLLVLEFMATDVPRSIIVFSTLFNNNNHMRKMLHSEHYLDKWGSTY